MASIQANAELHLKDLQSLRQPKIAKEFWSTWTKALPSSHVPVATEFDEPPKKKQKHSTKAVPLADNVLRSEDVVLASIDINLVSWFMKNHLILYSHCLQRVSILLQEQVGNDFSLISDPFAFRLVDIDENHEDGFVLSVSPGFNDSLVVQLFVRSDTQTTTLLRH